MRPSRSAALLVALAAAMPLARAAQAQTRTVPVRVSATILAHLETDGQSDLDLGTVWVTEAPVTEARQMGSFTFSHNTDVRIRVPSVPVVLRGPDGHTIPVSLRCALSREPGVEGTSVPCDALGDALVDVPGGVQDAWVQISGAIPEGARVATTGRYEAVLEFVLEAVY